MRKYIFLVLLLVFGYVLGTHLYEVASSHHLLFTIWTVYCIVLMSTLNLLFGTNKEQKLTAQVDKLTLIVNAYDQALVDILKKHSIVKQEKESLVEKVTLFTQIIKFAEQVTTHALALTPTEFESGGLPSWTELRIRIQDLKIKKLI